MLSQIVNIRIILQFLIGRDPSFAMGKIHYSGVLATVDADQFVFVGKTIEGLFQCQYRLSIFSDNELTMVV